MARLTLIEYFECKSIESQIDYLPKVEIFARVVFSGRDKILTINKGQIEEALRAACENNVEFKRNAPSAASAVDENNKGVKP